jgi:hypothetical protein
VPLRKKKHVSKERKSVNLKSLLKFCILNLYTEYAEVSGMRVISLFVFLLVSFTASANPSSDNLSYNQVLQFKIASLQLFSSFSSFIYFQGDDKNRSRLLSAKSQGDQALSAMSLKHEVLTDKWTDVGQYIESYQNHEFDGVDMSLEGGWSILRGELTGIINQLESKLREQTVFNQDSGLKLLKLQLKMEKVLSQYMGYANSTTGGYGVSYGDTPLEQQIEEISAEIKTLANSNKQHQYIAKQWRYIEKTLLAYNSQIAPFVVLHTFDKMRKHVSNYLQSLKPS